MELEKIRIGHGDGSIVLLERDGLRDELAAAQPLLELVEPILVFLLRRGIALLEGRLDRDLGVREQVAYRVEGLQGDSTGSKQRTKLQAQGHGICPLVDALRLDLVCNVREVSIERPPGPGLVLELSGTRPVSQRGESECRLPYLCLQPLVYGRLLPQPPLPRSPLCQALAEPPKRRREDVPALRKKTPYSRIGRGPAAVIQTRENAPIPIPVQAVVLQLLVCPCGSDSRHAMLDVVCRLVVCMGRRRDSCSEAAGRQH